MTGIFEQRSLLLESISESSVFCGEDSSNVTQVRRIICDARITFKDVLYPLLEQLIVELPNEVLYLTLDETSHHIEYCVVQIGLATDGVSLPLGFHIYAPDAAWADDARELLTTLDEILPHRCRIVLLADRIHTGEPFLSCLDELQWYFVFRASESTQIEYPTKGWMALKRVYKCPTPSASCEGCGFGSKASAASLSRSTNSFATAFVPQVNISYRICLLRPSAWTNSLPDTFSKEG